MDFRVLGLVLALAPLSAAAQSPRDPLPQGIVVQGKAVVKTAPDLATLSIKLRGDGATADAASTALAAAQKAVIGGIASLDTTASYRTGDISMREVRKGDCADAGNDIELSLAAVADAAAGEEDKGPCRVVGHVATIEATVEMRAVDKAGTAIGVARRLGASSASLGEFGLRDPAAARRSATAGAIADAKSRAEALAAASGAKLGPVVSILDSNERDATMFDATEQMSMLSVPPAALELPVAIDVSPKPVETSAQILIVYALLK